MRLDRLQQSPLASTSDTFEITFSSRIGRSCPSFADECVGNLARNIAVNVYVIGSVPPPFATNFVNLEGKVACLSFAFIKRSSVDAPARNTP